jgi:hypothetical protein
MTHTDPKFMDMAFEIEALKAELAGVTRMMNGAYSERNMLVAALAHLFPAGVKATDIPGWDAEWHNCVFIDTPAGQMSWHYHDNDAMLFVDLPPYWGEWDKHTTPEKYARLARLREVDILSAVTVKGPRK